MNLKKVFLLISLGLLINLSNYSYAEPAIYERAVSYKVDLENVKWYQKIVMFFMGLNWDEMTIKMTFQKDGDVEKVIAINAWSAINEDLNDSNKVFNLSVSSGETTGFLQFIKYTKFKSEEIPKLLTLFDYLYNDNQQEIIFDTTNLFEKEDGDMHCKLIKKKEGNKNLIEITTFNSSGNKNGSVEILMNPLPEKHLEKITSQLKIGIKITLIKINPE